MRKLLNSLYITTQGSYLSRKNETVVIRADGKKVAQFPLLALEAVVCFGRVGCSPFLMGSMAQAGVSLAFLSRSGRFLATVRGFAPGNVLLRRQHFRIADDSNRAVVLARDIVLAKIANSRTVLVRAARELPPTDTVRLETLRKTADRLLATVPDIRKCTDLNSLRGYEGEAARRYFEAFDSLRSPATDPIFAFSGRSRRPPLDPVNALLSFLYTLLLQDCRAACETVGLDSCVGFLHDDRPAKPSLALDLMEEFRAPIADRFVLSLINRKQLRPQDFVIRENGAVEMTDACRKTILVAWQNRKREEIQHPFTLESTPIGLLPYVQATLMARHIRGDMDTYPPYLSKS
jgi:CRISPR-associated protein Cas1